MKKRRYQKIKTDNKRLQKILQVFGAYKPKKNQIIVNIAFEKMLAKTNDKVLLVEGLEDRKVYEFLFDEKFKKINNNKSFFFINCYGKKNIEAYIDFEYNKKSKVFGIVDKDWEQNDFGEHTEKIIITKYANLEADLLNCENIDDLFLNFVDLQKHKTHINCLEKIMQQVYKGEYAQRSIKGLKHYSEDDLKCISSQDFLDRKLFIKNRSEKKKNLYIEEKGIHCAKYIFLILCYLDNNPDQKDDYLINWVKKNYKKNQIIQNNKILNFFE